MAVLQILSDTRKEGYSRRKAPWPWGHSHAFPTSLQWNLRQSLETATHLGQIEVINCSYSLYLPIQWIIDTIHLTRTHTPNVYIYIYVYTHIYIYIYTYIYTYTLCIYVYIYTLCIYIYIDIRMSTHSTYIHACVYWFSPPARLLVILGTDVFDYKTHIQTSLDVCTCHEFTADL